MSGIFGYIGKEQCRDILVQGIDTLYRRGNENMGIAFKQGDELCSAVCTSNATQLFESEYNSQLGIGCTTEKCTITPCCNNLFAVALDGEIENYQDILNNIRQPFAINSQEELLLALLCLCEDKDKIHLMMSVSNMILGDVSFAFICKSDNSIFAKKGESPLYIGLGDEEIFISSELIALKNICKKYIPLQDGQYAKISYSRAYVFDSKGKKIKTQSINIPNCNCVENTYNYDEELMCCSAVIKQSFRSMCENSKPDFRELKLNHRVIEHIDKIILTGCGSSMYVALAGAYNLELLTDIETLAIPSQELMNTRGVLNRNTLVIAISHYGESSHTISAVKRALRNGARTIAVTDNPMSYLAEICHNSINANCDFSCNEINLCSFSADYFALAMLGIYLGSKVGYISDLYVSVAMKMAEMLHGKQSTIGKNTADLAEIALGLQDSNRVYLTGYQVDEAIAGNISRNMRTIVNADVYSFSLYELAATCKNQLDSAFVIAIVSNNADMNIIRPCLEEIKNKCRTLAVFTTESYAQEFSTADYVICVGDSVPLLNPISITTALNKTILLWKNEIENRNSQLTA